MKTLAALLALGLFPLMATAQEVVVADTNSTVEAAQEVASADKMKVVTVTGVVSSEKDTLMLKTDSESYLLDMQFDEALVDKKVIATGSVTAGENGAKVFTPETIQVAQ